MGTCRRCGSVVSIAALILGLSLVTDKALAATVTWDGEAGDGIWSTPSNWDGDAVPGVDAEIILPASSGDIQITGVVNVGNEVEINSGTTLVISSGAQLNLDSARINGTGNLSNHGTIQGSAALDQIGSNLDTLFITNNSGGVINNVTLQLGGLATDPLFSNHGLLDTVTVKITARKGVFDNYSQITNSGVRVYCSISTFVCSTPANLPIINNHTGGTITGGTVEAGLQIFGSPNLGIFNNFGTITGATVDVWAEFNNAGTIDNSSGTFTLKCFTNSSLPIFGVLNDTGTFFGNPIVAECKVWDGGGDGINWSDPLNWLTDAVPTSSDNTIFIQEVVVPVTEVHLDVNFNFTSTGRIQIGSGAHLTADLAALVIDPGATLTIDDGDGTTSTQRLSLSTNGTLQNDSSFLNHERIGSGGVFINNGTFTNTGSYTSGTLGAIDNSGTLNNSGTINNNGTLNNSGVLDNTGGTVNNPCGSIFINTGTLLGNPIPVTCFTWDGGGDGVNWTDRFNWDGDEVPGLDSQIILPASSGEIQINAVVTVGNDVEINSGTTLVISSGAQLILDGARIKGTGNLSNHGTIQGSAALDQIGSNLDTLFITNNSGGVINNVTLQLGGLATDPLFSNHGLLDTVTVKITARKGVFDNYSQITNSNVRVYCSISTFVCSTPANLPIINNHTGGTITEGTVDVGVQIFGAPNLGNFNNYGTITDAAIEVFGELYNFGAVSGTITNNGTIVNDCDATIVADITGNPVTEAVCDTTPPVISVPADITVEATTSSGAIVPFAASANDDTDGPIAPTCDPISGSVFPLGTTTVSCTAIDAAGNAASAAFNINVVDTTPPVLTVPADVTVEANAVLSTVTIGTATATDVFPVTVTNDAPATFPLGQTIVTWVATDANGNQVQDTQEVNVEDTTPPVLTVPADITAEANGVLSTLTIGTATATDIFAVTITNDAPASFSLGTTVVTWTATDANGNQAQDTQEVTVADSMPPVLTVPADIVVEANGAQSTVAIGTATATDVFPVTITNDAPATFPLGTTVVTWFATDTSGNQSQGTQAVTVVDTMPPTVIPPPDLTADATAPLTTVDIGLATATDIVGIASLSNDAPSNGFPVGTTVVTWTAIDVSGNVGTAQQRVTLTNVAPVLTPIPDATIDEGDAYMATISFSDADSVNWTATVDYGDGAGAQPLTVDTATMTMALNHVYPDNDAYLVAVSITDAEGASDSTSFVVTVNNVAPTLSNFLVAPTLAELGAHTVSASVDFTDPGVLDTHTATIDWGDGVVEPAVVTETGGSGTASGDHAYLATGVYSVTVQVTDKDGGTSSNVFQFVVVYDASGGFVTGGGWIDSPLGACQLSASCATLTGKANFGFVSKYKKGATTPTGNTEFQFKAGDINFHSSSYDWLVIAGAKAMYKGTGTINGAGNYGFMLSAIDADLTPSTDVDLFRIKIWDKDNGDFVVYDNQMADGEDADPTTSIGGGSIKIHKAK